MALSETYTDVAAYQAYVQQYNFDLITDAFIKTKTASMVTTHEGVKGKLTLTRMVLAQLVKRYEKDFGAPADQATFTPRTIETFKVKVEHSVCPSDLEGSYLGELRKKGQSPMDWPMQAYVLGGIAMQIAQEIELALWRAEKTGTPLSTDGIYLVFDGYRQIVKDAITATDVTATATGAITATNAVAAVEATFGNLSSTYMDLPIDIYMGVKGRINYFKDYRERYGKYTSPMGEDGSYRVDFSNQAYIHGMGGLGDDDIIITPRTNLHYAFDAAADSATFNFEQNHRQLDIWADFLIGAQIGIAEDGILAANDSLG